MKVSTLLKAGSLSWVLVACWADPAEAVTDCLSTLRIDAPAGARETMRARLQQGRLSDVSADHCRQAAVHLEQKGSRWELQFTHGDTSIARDVKSPQMAAVWVESWLVPATTLDIQTPQSADASRNGDGVAGANAPYAGVAPMGVEASAALYGAAGSAWLGPGFRFHSPIAGLWWLEPHAGLAYAVSNTPSEASRSISLSTALGRDVLRTSTWFVRPGCEIGVMSLLWHDRSTELRMTGPMLGGQFAVGFSIARSMWLVGRVHTSLLFADRTETSRRRVCSDDRCDSTDRMDVVTNARSLDPAWVGGLDLGLLLHWGDFS